MTSRFNGRRSGLMIASGVVLTVGLGLFSDDVLSQIARFAAKDPGVRGGAAWAGGMLPGLNALEQQIFGVSREAFQETQSVQGTIPDTEAGLGPRFNLDSCVGCHAHPDVGGSSPAVNPQVEMAKKEGALNEIPAFIRRDGPVREARFKFNADGTPDGGNTGFVHFHRSHTPAGEKGMAAHGHGGKSAEEGYWLKHIAVGEFDMMDIHFTPGTAMNFMPTPAPKCGA